MLKLNKITNKIKMPPKIKKWRRLYALEHWNILTLVVERFAFTTGQTLEHLFFDIILIF